MKCVKLFLYSSCFSLVLHLNMAQAASPQNTTNPPMSATDKTLLKLLSHPYEAVAPPKIHGKDIFLETQPQQKPMNVLRNNANVQRCLYANQSYVEGDMIKTDQGWLRCTPTFFYSDVNPINAQNGNPAWTKVQ